MHSRFLKILHWWNFLIASLQVMFQTVYLKGLLIALLLVLLLYGVAQVYKQHPMLCEDISYDVKKQQVNLSPKKVTYSEQRQQQELQDTTNGLNVFQNLVDLSYSQIKFHAYTQGLSSSQITSVVRWVGVDNLNMRKSQEKFLRCAGIGQFRKLRGKRVKCRHLSSLNLPQSSQHCKNMSFQRSGPIVALSSIPGSGNSWVRQLLESATGIYTGAVYCDSSYVRAGMIGEGIDTNNVLAIKAHYSPTFVKKLLNIDKAIYIVRSPFGAILSENNRNVARTSKKYASAGDSHIVEVDYKYANNSVWKAHVKKQSRAWKAQVMQWLTYKTVPVLIVGYENLRSNTYSELKRMLDFLGYLYSEDDLLCAVKSSGETFHRNHTRKDLQPYSPELQKFVLNEIKQVDAALLKHRISLYHPY